MRTNISGVFISTSSAPVEFSFKIGKRANVQQIIQGFLNCTSPNVVNCDLGVLYSSDSSQDTNSLASQLQSKFSRMPESLKNACGPCFLIGEDVNGHTVSLSKESVKSVMDLYHEMTGHNVSKRSAKRDGPNRAKRDFEFFQKEFFKDRKTELKDQNLPFDLPTVGAEAREAWKNLSAESKSPFLNLAAADKVRYQEELVAYLKKNPPRPTKPRNAYQFFCQDNPEKEQWKNLSAEEKLPYDSKATEDKVRYETQLAEFKTHCEENGKNFEELISTKRAKISKSADTGSARKKVKSEEPSKKANAPKSKEKKVLGSEETKTKVSKKKSV